ncbi:MAG: hypothetical protein ACE369_04885 [Roseovarius sp.]
MARWIGSERQFWRPVEAAQSGTHIYQTSQNSAVVSNAGMRDRVALLNPSGDRAIAERSRPPCNEAKSRIEIQQGEKTWTDVNF